MSDDGHHGFTAALQAALTVDEVECAFLAAATDVVPATGLGLYRIDGDSGAMLDVRARVDVDFLTDYEDYGRQDDPVLAFVLRHRRPIDSSRVVGRPDWDGSGARTALRVGGYYHSLEAPVVVAGGLYGTMNFAREADQPAFTEADLLAARAAGEQLGLATERAVRFEVTGRRLTTYEDVLERLPQALVITDLDARVLFRNRAARGTEPDDLVAASIAEAMSEFREHRRRVHTSSGWDARGNRRVIVKSLRLPDRDDAALTLVYETPPEETTRLPVWEVLSRREQQIAELVSHGLTNKQIADAVFVSENTVKQHLKRVFAKTDVRNRAELMQRIWTSGTGPTGPTGPTG